MSSKSKLLIWNREQVKQLIEAIEGRECLWNVKSPFYHNQTKRRAAISEIASEINMPNEEVKKKIHTLRAQHSKERAKMKSSKSGSGVDETYKTKWEFFEMLQFMFRHTDTNVTADSMDIGIAEQDEASSNVEATNEIGSCGKSAFDNTLTSSQSSITADTEDVTQESPITHRPCGSSRQMAKRKKLSGVELQEQAAMNRCLSIIGQAKPRDEWSIFGENVANELRLLQTAPDLQFKLKNLIQQSVLDISYAYAARQFPSPSPAATQYTNNHSPSSPALSPSPASLDYQYQPSQDTQKHFEQESQESNLSYFINLPQSLSSAISDDKP